jgi:crotonobetainyl-CoA:carnitine CoA-transferase CaiB-like acyl-CoA transferase
VLGAHDLLHDAQLVARGFWQRLSRPYIGEHYAPAAPYRLDGRVPPIAWPAPTLGEHNATVLGGVLGLDADARAALEARGIIGTRARADAPGPANEQRTSG